MATSVKTAVTTKDLRYSSRPWSPLHLSTVKTGKDWPSSTPYKEFVNSKSYGNVQQKAPGYLYYYLSSLTTGIQIL